jgi:hypothetical protein
LDGTKDANEQHTIVHLMYTKTQEFQELPQEIQELIMNHIMQEHDANPAVGDSADLLNESMGTDEESLAGTEGPTPGGMGTPFDLSPQGPGPQAQVADLEPTNFSDTE